MGAHYKVVEFEDAMGRKVSYTELETGMNYRETERGPWLPSREEIIITPKGDAAAPYGPNKVIFAANLNTEGAIQLTTQEGQLLRSHVLGLAYVDEESGQSLLIAELRDTVAVLVEDNVLLYEDAFDGVHADVRYTWRKDGFEQDIILRSKPLPPAEYGLNPDTTRLTVWTEFLDAPVPKTKQAVLSKARLIGRSRVSEVIDDTVEFGATRIGAGKAFPIDNKEDSEPVAKRWIKSEGRQFLMEQVLWPVLESKIETLPDYAGIDRANPLKRQFAGNVPPRRIFTASVQTNDLRRAMAQVETREPRAGFVIDYDLQSTHADFYFTPGGTYVVNGYTTLSGTTRLGGGVAVKFAPGGRLKLSGILQCETSPWWPAVFTGKNDNTVGIATSSSVAAYYAHTAIQADQLTGDLHDIKVRQAQLAIDWSTASGRLSNIQIVDCGDGFLNWGNQLRVHNLLAVNLINLFGGNWGSVEAQHWTLVNIPYIQWNDGGTIQISLVNSILSGVGDLEGVTQLNCQTVGSGAFSPVGFGGYYLPSNSALIDQGTSNIDPVLANELRRMSVLPPQMLTGTLPAISVLGKVALLDTGAPDLGYHYAPLDYVVRSATVPAGGTLILTNGAAMGVDYNGASWGLVFGTGAKFISHGSPLNLNRFVAAQASQERGGSKPGTRAFVHDGPSSSMTDELRFRFTELTQLADDGYFLYVGTKFSQIEWSHSKNKGIWLTLSQGAGQKIGITNNLWLRGYNHFTGANGSEIHLRNNTIRDGNWYFNSAQSAWTARDNLFDSMLNLSTTGSSWTSSHNAYWNSTALPGATSTLTLTSLAYDAGLLGNFYLTPNSPLINAGSRTADQAGLYHYTTQVGQAKEVGSTVDIGFHYVPVASYLASDGFSGSLGQSPWSYRYTDTRKGLPAGLMNEYLVGNGWWHIWEDTYCLVAADIQHPGSTHDSVRTFQSPFSGRVLITGNLRNFDPGEAICGDGIEYRLLRNTDTLKDWQTVYRSATWIPVSVETEVQAGDLLQSQISAVTWDNNCDSAQWNPLIIYPDLLSDEDADGIPDYMEDRNGNGIVDTGETNPSLADSDFDGVNDGDELTDGTDPLNAASTTHRSLASFSFNGADWIGDQGQIPLNTRGLATGEPGMEGQAVSIVGAPWSKILNYRTVEPDGKPNLAFAAGTVAFWFKPNWTCATLGGWGPDPGAWGRLFNLGEWSQSATYGFWDVGLNPDGTQISQGVQDGLGNSGGTPWGYINGSFDNWVHIAVTYSPTYSAVYVNGVQVSGAAWGSLIPPKAVRDKGFFIGSDTAGHQQAQGSYDLLKTYNYPMSAEEVRALFVSENKNLVTDPTVEKANQISLQSPWVKVPGTAGGNWFHNNQTLTCNSHPWCLSSEGYQKIGVVQSDTRYTLKFDLYQATTYAGAMLASEVYLAVGPSRIKVGDAVPINCGVAGSTQTRNWTTYTVSYKSSGSNSVHWAQDLYLVFKATVSGGGTDQTTTQPILAQTALDNFVLQKAPGNLIDRGDFAGFADYANTGDNAMIAPWQGTGGWNGTSGGSKGIYPYAGVGILDVYSYANTAEAWQKIGKLEADTLYHAYMDQMVHLYATNVTIKGNIYFAVGSSRTPIGTVWEKALTNPQQPAMSGMNLAFRSPAPGDSLLGQDLYLVVRCEGTGDMAYSNGGYFKGRVVIDNVVATKTPVASSDADTDADGLSNSDELARGTDPFQKDTDYDGVNDGEEVVTFRTDPKNSTSTKNRLLASFGFSDASFVGDQEQVPTRLGDAVPVPGLVGNALGVERLEAKGLTYMEIEANGAPNINCRQGSISFWFKPNWSSAGQYGGNGLPSNARLVEVGDESTDARAGWWCLALDSQGTTLSFTAQSAGNTATFVSRAVQFVAGRWYHVALTYGPTSTALYLDGQKLGGDGAGVTLWPEAKVRRNGLRIGSDSEGAHPADGAFDLLETWNYPLTQQKVVEYYGKTKFGIDGEELSGRRRLAKWDFNGFFGATGLKNSVGQTPAFTGSGITAEASWDIPGINIKPDGANGGGLSYDLYVDPLHRTLTPRKGTVSFWFMPNWSSGSSIAGGPNRYSLLNVSQKTTSAPTGIDPESVESGTGAYWGLEVNGTGTELSFWLKKAGASREQLLFVAVPTAAPFVAAGATSKPWRHIALTYSDTGIQLYLDGQPIKTVDATQANKLLDWPGIAANAEEPYRLWIGGREGVNLVNGSFEDIQTFNYVKTPGEIGALFHEVADLDTDRDGLTDLDELKRGFSPNNPDSDGDGLPDGWEFERRNGNQTLAFNPTDPADGAPGVDWDGDGYDNYHEFLYGLDPFSGDSPLLFTTPSFDVAAFLPKDNGFVGDRSGLINIDFGGGALRKGPADAGSLIESDNPELADVWNLAPTAAYLKDAGGVDTRVRIGVRYGPVSFTHKPPDNVGTGGWSGSYGAVRCHSDGNQIMVYAPDCPECAIEGGGDGVDDRSLPKGGLFPWANYQLEQPVRQCNVQFIVQPGDPPQECPLEPFWPDPTASCPPVTIVENPWPFQPPWDLWRPISRSIIVEKTPYYPDASLTPVTAPPPFSDSPWNPPFSVSSSSQNLVAYDVGGTTLSLTGAPVAVSPSDQHVYLRAFDLAGNSSETGTEELLGRDFSVSGLDWFFTGGELDVTYDYSRARAHVTIDGLTTSKYRLYLYTKADWNGLMDRPSTLPARGPVDAQKPLSIIITDPASSEAVKAALVSGTVIPGVEVPMPKAGEAMGRAKVVVQPVGGVIDLVWKHRNSALAGIQLVELRPLTAPVVVWAKSGIAGVGALRWKAVPTALNYEISRRSSGTEGPFQTLETVASLHYLDTTVVIPLGQTSVTCDYKVRAFNEEYSSETIYPNVTISAPPPGSDYPPVLNSFRPLAQAYEGAPFVFGTPMLRAAADVFDFENKPLSFVVVKLLSGTLEWTELAKFDEVSQTLMPETKTELHPGEIVDGRATINGSVKVLQLQPGVRVRWVPEYGKVGDVKAMELRAFDGVNMSYSAAVLPINVRPEASLVWWGDWTTLVPGDGSLPSWGPWRGAMIKELLYANPAKPVIVGGAFEDHDNVVNGRLRNVIQMVDSYSYCKAALTSDGTVWTWGFGHEGGLGDGPYLDFVSSEYPTLPPYPRLVRANPEPVPGLSGIVSIAKGPGAGTLLAIDSDGTVWAWGNSGGLDVLGPEFSEAQRPYSTLPYVAGTMYPYSGTWLQSLLDQQDNVLNSIWVSRLVTQPVALGIFKDVVRVDASGPEWLSLTADGDLQIWNEHDESGELRRLVPPRSMGIPGKVVQFVPRTDVDGFGLALTDAGRVYAWGVNNLVTASGLFSGLLGDPEFTADSSEEPHLIPSLRDVRQIDVKYEHAIALKGDGSVVQWGRQLIYDIDNSPESVFFHPPSPTRVTGLNRIRFIETTLHRQYAISESGKIYAWGRLYPWEINPSKTWREQTLKEKHDFEHSDQRTYYPAQITGLFGVECLFAEDANLGGRVYASGRLGSDAPENVICRPGDGFVEVSWNRMADVSQYYVMKSVSPDGDFALAATLGAASSAGRSTYTDRVVQNGRTYYYKVAGLLGGQLRESDPVMVTPQPPPQAPDGLAVAPLSRQLRASWNVGVDADFYDLYRKIGTGEWEKIIRIENQNRALYKNIGTEEVPDLVRRKVEFTDAFLIPNQAYSYRVRAVNSVGESTDTAAVTQMPTIAPAPNAPATPTATAFGGGVQLKWNKAQSTQGKVTYVIRAAKADCDVNGAYTTTPPQTFNWKVVALVPDNPDVNVLTCDIRGLGVWLCYAFQITTVDDRGEGEPSAIASAKVKSLNGETAPVVTLVASKTGPGSLYVRWKCSPSAPEYTVNLWKKNAVTGTYPASPEALCESTYARVNPYVFEDTAEFWMTDLPAGDYKVTVAPQFASGTGGSGSETPFDGLVVAPLPLGWTGWPTELNSAYDPVALPPLQAKLGHKKVILSWWGQDPSEGQAAQEAQAQRVQDAFADWRFVLLRKNLTAPTLGHDSEWSPDTFPCIGYETAADGGQREDRPVSFVFKDKEVVLGHAYEYRLVAISPGQEVFEQSIDTLEGGAEIKPVAAFPDGGVLAAEAKALNGAVRIDWTYKEGAVDVDLSQISDVEYQVWFRTSPGEDYQKAGSVPIGTKTFVHVPRNNGDICYYQVRAVVNEGSFVVSEDYVASAEVSATPTSQSPMMAPQNFRGELGANGIRISWDEVPGATAYDVSQIPLNGGTATAVKTVSKPEYWVSGTVSGAEQRFKVQAKGIAGGNNETAEIRVRALAWAWPAEAPGGSLVTSFIVDRQCSGESAFSPIATVKVNRYVDIRTLFVENNAAYQVRPQPDDPPEDPPISGTGPGGLAEFDDLELPPTGLEIPTDDVVVRVVDWSSEPNSPSQVTAPTNLVFVVNVEAPVDPGTGATDIRRVLVYVDGVLIGADTDLPYEVTWHDPDGSFAGVTHTVVARAVDLLGQVRDSAPVYIEVKVEPILKSFMTAVTDAQLPGPGLSASLTRSYDSANKVGGILGVGWKLDWEQARMLVPGLGENWERNISAFGSQFDLRETASHEIQVILPDGSMEAFRPYPSTDGELGGSGSSTANVYSFRYLSQEAGLGSLAESDTGSHAYADALEVVSGNSEGIKLYGTDDVDGASDEDLYKPESYTYTGPDGSRYRFTDGNAMEGDNRVFTLVSVTDRYGNSVTYTPSYLGTLLTGLKIVHSNGRRLTLQPKAGSVGAHTYELYDTHSGQTPTGNPIVRYYVSSATGSPKLTKVDRLRDRSLANSYEPTTYSYVGGNADATETIGLLQRITNPENVVVLENDYYGIVAVTPGSPEAGWLGYLKSQTDAFGTKTEVQHTTAGYGETKATQSRAQSSGLLGPETMPGSGKTSPDLGETVATLDSSGRIASTKDDSSGKPSFVGYDSEGRVSYTTDSQGRLKQFEYDGQGRLAAVTDETGNRSQVTYGLYGQPAKTVDAAGNPTSYEYYTETATDGSNPKGTLKRVVEAGIQTDYTYNAKGQTLTETRTVPGSTPAISIKTTYEYYDSSGANGKVGDLKAVKQPLWPGHMGGDSSSKLYTTEYSYDEQGNRKTEKRWRTTVKRSSGAVMSDSELEGITTTYTCDAQNRVIGTVVASSLEAAPLQTSSMTYNASGKVATSTDDYGRITTMTYDAKGNLIETKYPDNTVTRTAYDGYGRTLWQQERALPVGANTTAPATFTSYDSAGRVLKTTRYIQVTLSKVSAQPLASGPVTDFRNQFRGTGGNQPSVYAASWSDPEPTGRTQFDTEGRVEYTLSPRGALTKNVYDPDTGRRKAVEVYTTYTDSGGVLASTDTPVQKTTYIYDQLGRQHAVLDTLGRQTVMSYDPQGRVVATLFPKTDGDATQRSRQTVYDLLGRRVREIDEAGVATAFDYDIQDRLVAVTQDWKENPSPDEEEFITTYTYDELGNQITQTDAEGRTTRYEYDALGRRTHRILPKAGPVDLDEFIGGAHNPVVETVTYTKNPPTGVPSTLVKTVRDFRGREITYTHDAMGRLEAITPKLVTADQTPVAIDPAQRTTVAYTYTPTGQRAKVLQAGGTEREVKLAYDTAGRLKVKETPEGTLTYGYDVYGAIESISARYTYTGWAANPPYLFSSLTANAADNSRAEWHYRYDTLGRLEKVCPDGTGNNPDATYTYDEVGNLKTVTYRNGHVATYTYNERNMLRQVQAVKSATVVANFDYDDMAGTGQWAASTRLSPTGLRRGLQEKIGGATVLRGVSYQYDRLSRLVKEDIATGGTGPVGAINYKQTLPNNAEGVGYDAVGNRKAREIVLPDGVSSTLADKVIYQYPSYDDRDLINDGSYAYDDAGNTQTDTLGATYAYDAMNRLVSRTGGGQPTITLLYDADGNRVSKTVGSTTTRYLVEDRNHTGYAQVMEEFELSEPSSGGLSGHWRFDETSGTQAVDASGNGRHGNLVNGPVWSSGRIGGGLLFNGTSSRVNVPSSVIATSDTQYSYGAWFNWNGTGGGSDGRKFILETTGSGSPYVLSAAITTAAKIQIYTSLQGSTPNMTGPTTIASGRWYHLLVTWDRNGGSQNLKLYLDGVLEVQTTTVAAYPVATTGLNVGTHRDANNRWFGGWIDDVRVYNRVLSGAEIQSLAGSRVQYTYGHDLISQKRGTTTTWYGYDGLGSVRYLTDANGAVTDTYTYDAFGIELAKTGTTPNHYRYTGEQWDADLGMYYLRARYYKPEIGRFWTMDSYEGSQDDPLSLHKYLYVHANPVNGIDPSGHEFNLSGTLITAFNVGRLASQAGFAAWQAYNRASAAYDAIQDVALVASIFADGTVDDEESEILAELIFDHVKSRLQGYALRAISGAGGKVLKAVTGQAARLRITQAGIDKVKTYYKTDIRKLANQTRNTPAGPVSFDHRGWPKFDKYLYQGGINTVRIQLTGSRKSDFDAADKLAGISKSWRGQHGYVWHHHQKLGTMQLVKKEAHTPGRSGGVGHIGGAAIFKRLYGWGYEND